MSSVKIEPIYKEFLINASQEKCFRTFTERIDAWWPRAHHIGQSPLKQEVLETHQGGRWYGISEDGSECEIGRVLFWDPFERLLLSWQINAQWQYDPEFVTEIDLQFIAEGPQKTRFKMEHRNLERYGINAKELRGQMDSPDGWNGSLEAFKTLAET